MLAKVKIFVYGTLKRGWGNNAIIHDQTFVDTARTVRSNFTMYSLGGYPGVVAGDSHITGEIWEVDDAAFKRCDRLEGHPTFYRRETTEVIDSQGNSHECWMYVYQYAIQEGSKPIASWNHAGEEEAA